MNQMRNLPLVETNLEDKVFAASDCSGDLHTKMEENNKDVRNAVTCLLGTLVPFIRDAPDWFFKQIYA